MPLRVLAEAAEDIQEAADWYEGRRAGLGDDFLDAIQAAFVAVERTPSGFSAATPAIAGREVRRFVVTRFPYAVFYEVLPDETVVLAVTHHRRKPGGWHSRQP